MTTLGRRPPPPTQVPLNATPLNATPLNATPVEAMLLKATLLGATEVTRLRRVRHRKTEQKTEQKTGRKTERPFQAVKCCVVCRFGVLFPKATTPLPDGRTISRPLPTDPLSCLGNRS